MLNYLALVVIASATLAQSQLVQQRCLGQPSDVNVAVNSYRNQTGHWLAEIELENRVSKKSAGVNQKGSSHKWLMNVKLSSADCEDDSSLKILLSFTGSPNRVGVDYELVTGVGFYKVHVVGAEWTLARDKCAEEGTHLVIINSDKEADAIVQLLRKYPSVGTSDNTLAWVGAYERGFNAYFTVFGEALNTTGYLRWGPNKPGSRDADDGIHMYRNGPLGDAPKKQKLAYICEQELAI